MGVDSKPVMNNGAFYCVDEPKTDFVEAGVALSQSHKARARSVCIHAYQRDNCRTPQDVVLYLSPKDARAFAQQMLVNAEEAEERERREVQG